MSLAKRHRILDNLNTALSALISDDAALVQPATVERCLRSWDDETLGDSRMPWIGFCSTRGVGTPQPFGHYDVVIEIGVWMHIHAPAPATLEERSAMVSDAEDMLLATILADPTRGGNAITTTFKDSFSDDGHPDFEQPEGKITTLTMRFEIKYLRTTGQTT